MKNYTVNSTILAILDECTFFDKGSGLKSLPLTSVRESKIKNKYIYSLFGNESIRINAIHENLNKTLLSRIPINHSATAYVKNKSYLDFIEPHRNNYYFLRLDIKNFFHYINKDLIRNSLSEHISNTPLLEGCTQTHLDFVCCALSIVLPDSFKNKDFVGKSVLPIGFKCSPVVSNIIFRKLDILIEKFCSEYGITYRRYADDMLFSCSDFRKENHTPFLSMLEKSKNNFLHSKRFIDQISFILNIDEFKINKKKTISSKKYLSLNGYTIEGTNYPYISGKIRISNKKTKIIDKIIHECNLNKSDMDIYKALFKIDPYKIKFKYKPKEKFISTFCESQINNVIIGYRSYLISILKYNDKYNCIDQLFLTKCNSLLVKLNNLVETRLN